MTFARVALVSVLAIVPLCGQFKRGVNLSGAEFGGALPGVEGTADENQLGQILAYNENQERALVAKTTSEAELQASVPKSRSSR